MIERRITVVSTGVIMTPCSPSRALPFSPYGEYVVIILFAKGGSMRALDRPPLRSRRPSWSG